MSFCNVEAIIKWHDQKNLFVYRSLVVKERASMYGLRTRYEFNSLLYVPDVKDITFGQMINCSPFLTDL